MESREKCELIIQIFNKKMLRGAKEPLLVKFADSGNKKRNLYKNKDQPSWDRSEVSFLNVFTEFVNISVK